MVTGNPMEATPPPRPAESPFILEKHYKNAHGPHQGRYSPPLGIPVLASLLHGIVRLPIVSRKGAEIAEKQPSHEAHRLPVDDGEKSGTWSQESPAPASGLFPATFAEGIDSLLLSRVRREADVRFLRVHVLTRRLNHVLSREILKKRVKGWGKQTFFLLNRLTPNCVNWLDIFFLFYLNKLISKYAIVVK